MRLLKLPLALVLVCLSLTGCESLKPVSRCGSVDWFEAGRSDGIAGRSADYVFNHRTECGPEFGPEQESLYQVGYNRGLNDYCHPENGFTLGRTGAPWRNVCPEPLDRVFLSALERGQEVRAIQQVNDRLDRRISALSQRLRRTVMTEGDRAQLLLELSGLEREHSLNERKINTIERF